MMSCGKIATETTIQQTSYDDHVNNNKALYGVTEVVSSCVLLLLKSKHGIHWYQNDMNHPIFCSYWRSFQTLVNYFPYSEMLFNICALPDPISQFRVVY